MNIDMEVVGNFLLHALAALGMGVAIGIERQLGQHPAGVRTNALVCLGSALFVYLTFLVGEKDSPTRIAAQVVSGIGFICGGAILREGITVRGMNTAATLWCTAAIGALIGSEKILLAFLGTVAIIAAHLLFRPLAHAIDKYTEGKGESELLYEVKLVCRRIQEGAVRTLLIEQIKAARLRLQGMSLQDAQPPDCVEMTVHLYAVQHNEEAMNYLVSTLASQEAVDRVSWTKSH
jgi:putative Mg2+ transporter-C (MgtC) family protein